MKAPIINNILCVQYHDWALSLKKILWFEIFSMKYANTECVSLLLVLTVVLSLDWWATLRGIWLSSPAQKKPRVSHEVKQQGKDMCDECSHTTHIHIQRCTLKRQLENHFHIHRRVHTSGPSTTRPYPAIQKVYKDEKETSIWHHPLLTWTQVENKQKTKRLSSY